MQSNQDSLISDLKKLKEYYKKHQKQSDITFDYMAALVGNITKVLIEGYMVDDDVYVGRTYMDAPNIDGYVFINTGEALMTGDFVKVKITGASDYDLIGERLWIIYQTE